MRGGCLRILFLIQGLTVAASRYRVLQYLPFLESSGIETEVAPFPSSPGGWLRLRGGLGKAGIIFVQRKRLPLFVLLFLKRLGKTIVYDFDDAVMFRNSLSSNPYSLRRRLSFKRMLKFTDLVIAGNSFLRKEAERYHKNVRVLPTPVDGDRYTSKVYGEKRSVNIGWIGDHGSIHYMESYKDVWEEIGKRYRDVELTIICDTFIEAKGIKINRIPWAYETEIESLKKLDIGVMPLFNDLWSEGKCGFKIIQYLGMGLPAVCTPVGINREVIEDGVNGFWAQTKEEWVSKLSVLVEDSAMRERMGREGRRKVVEGYTVQACAPKLLGWLKAIRD